MSFLADLTIHHKMRRRQLAGKTCWFQENPGRPISQSDFSFSLQNLLKNARTWRTDDPGQRKSLPFLEEGVQIGIQWSKLQQSEEFGHTFLSNTAWAGSNVKYTYMDYFENPCILARFLLTAEMKNQQRHLRNSNRRKFGMSFTPLSVDNATLISVCLTWVF